MTELTSPALARATEPLWRRPGLPKARALDADVRADVVVVGGGITGVTTALLLAEAGKRVVLLESRRIGAGVTGSTTAHLTEALDTRYHVLESRFGREGARLARQSTRAAIDKMTELAAGNECGLERVDGYLFSNRQQDLPELDTEHLAAERAGARVERVEDIPLRLPHRGGLWFRDQAQLRPLDYLAVLLDRSTRASVRIFEGVTVEDVQTKGRLQLETNVGRRVNADAIVLATHAPYQNLKLELELAQYRSYAVAGRAAQPLRGLFWDMQDPYHYYRSSTIDGEHYVIIGGGDHRTGTVPQAGPEAPFRELVELGASLGIEAEWRWSAQVAESADGLPFIGKPDPDVELYLAQGFSGNGMTFGTLSAMLISDALLGRSNPYADLYRADRFKPLASAKALVSENVETAGHLTAGHLKPVSDAPVEQLARGEGRILKVDGHKLAVFRDQGGALHAVSAVCTHQGCQVAFNPVECSWDCPCHGSRFDIDGQVLDGPAKRALEKKAL